jgi:hypothetical protein
VTANLDKINAVAAVVVQLVILKMLVGLDLQTLKAAGAATAALELLL